MAAAIRLDQLVYLRHKATGFYLSSNPNTYDHPDSSRYQLVGAISTINDSALWRVKNQDGEDAALGRPLRNGDILRLEHVQTQKNLHSHRGVPASNERNQQEVICYGESGVGDTKDNWRLEVEGGDEWRRGTAFRLVHVESVAALHSHDRWVVLHGALDFNLREVTCYTGHDPNDFWCVEPLQSHATLSDALKDSPMVQIINLVASLASVTGVTFLFLRDQFKNRGWLEFGAVSLLLLCALAIGIGVESVLIALGVVIYEAILSLRQKIRTPLKIAFWCLYPALLCAIGLTVIGIILQIPRFTSSALTEQANASKPTPPTSTGPSSQTNAPAVPPQPPSVKLPSPTLQK